MATPELFQFAAGAPSGENPVLRNRKPPAQNFPTLVITSSAEVIPATTTTTAGAGEIIARGTRFIHSQRAAFERLPIQARDCPLNIFAFAELDKAEATRRSCHLVTNHYG